MSDAGDPKGVPMDAARRRRVATRLYALASAALLVLLALQLNYLSYRHYARWDWTTHSIYTLSDRTKAVLRELAHDVEIWILLSEGEQGFTELRNLLGRYQAETGRITVHYVDPDRDPGGYREVAQRFALGGVQVGEGRVLSDVAAVIDAGTRHWQITRDDLVSTRFDPMSDENTVELDVEGERAITGALVELSTGRPTRVCVTRGHGELQVSGSGRSLAGFAREVQRENLELTPIDTRGVERIDAGCDAVAIVGPEVAFTAEEVDTLRAYVRGGGNLFVALDPVIARNRASFTELGIEPMLRDFGIRVDRTVVIEPNPALLPAGVGNPIGPFAVVGWGEHAITRPFASLGLPIVMSEVRSVTPVDEGRATVLLTTSEQSYAETDVRGIVEGSIQLGADPDDVRGPVPVAVATTVEVARPEPRSPAGAEDEEEDAGRRAGGRIVVVGDATMFASEYVAEPTVVNGSFVAAAIGWLTQREALIAIDARSYRHRPVSMSQDDVLNLFLRVVVLIPLAFVFLGFAVWWNRRS
ncbi:MAG: Gldg family protein [Sandaracinaceae bacterium]|nr:Gldg family protein [Sandaracinaceae bacterium]